MTINNNNIFGLFTLNEARGSRLTGDWLHTDTIANYGWFGGGSLGTSPITVSATVYRIDFSNDLATATPRGPLSLARYGLAATGNSNYGWFGGGYYPAPLLADPPYLSTVDRIDFSNDSSTSPIRGPLSLARVYSAATGNSNYGWFGGGTYYPYGGGPIPFTSSVDRIDFSNDASTASPRGSLSLARYGSAATGNSNYGWFGGGFPGPGQLSTVDRIDFSNDLATASPRGPLSSVRSGSAATGNSNYGWFGGGYTPSVSATVNRIDFSNDLATASPRGSLSSVRSSAAATGNSNYGWFGGGYTPSVSATVNRIDFSNDSSTASPRGSLSLARAVFGATSGVLNIRRQKAGNYGWFGGGFPGPVATVDRIDFSNDSATASPRGPLSAARYRLAATGNSNYGWFGGGNPGSVATVDRIDFSNDSSTASPRGSLSLARYFLASTGNSNYGWFGGGLNGPLSTVDRINFSNDSATASPRGSLSLGRSRPAATSNTHIG